MKSLLLLLVLLCSAAWLQAQQGSQTSSPQSGSAQSDTASAPQAVTGCLQSKGGKFVLTDTAGNKYELQGDTSKLTEHVGHQVQITGTVAKTSASSSTESPSGSTSASSRKTTIQVEDVKHISETCSSMSK